MRHIGESRIYVVPELSTDNEPVSYTHLDVYKRQLQRWLTAAGITKKITFHCTRHSFGSLHVEMGTDMACLLYTSRCV